MSSAFVRSVVGLVGPVGSGLLALCRYSHASFFPPFIAAEYILYVFQKSWERELRVCSPSHDGSRKIECREATSYRIPLVNRSFIPDSRGLKKTQKCCARASCPGTYRTIVLYPALSPPEKQTKSWHVCHAPAVLIVLCRTATYLILRESPSSSSLIHCHRSLRYRITCFLFFFSFSPFLVPSFRPSFLPPAISNVPTNYGAWKQKQKQNKKKSLRILQNLILRWWEIKRPGYLLGLIRNRPCLVLTTIEAWGGGLVSRTRVGG